MFSQAWINIYSLILSSLVFLCLLSPTCWSLLSSLGKLVIVAWISWQLSSVATRFVLLKWLKPISTEDRWILLLGCNSDFDSTIIRRLVLEGFGVFSMGCGETNISRAREFEDKVTGELRELASRVVFLQDCSMADDDSISSAITQIEARLKNTSPESGQRVEGKLHGVIARETNSFWSRIDWDGFDESFTRALDFDLYGVMSTIRQAMPLLRKSKGRIMFITSLPSIPSSRPFNMTSAVTNATFHSLIECLRREVLYFGVDVINVKTDYDTHMFTRKDLLLSRLESSWKNTSREKKNERDYLRVLKLIEDSTSGHDQPSGRSEERGKIFDKVTDTLLESLTTRYPQYNYFVLSTTSQQILWFIRVLVPKEMSCYFLRIYHAVCNIIPWGRT